MNINQSCSCKYKAYTLVCCQCGQKAVINELDNKEKKLKEMKERLEKLIIEKTILRMEIRELEDDINGCTAYLIRYSAAKRFLQNVDSTGKFIYSPDFCKDYVADRFIYNCMKTYIVNPPLFTYRDNNDSTIHPEHLRFHENSKEHTKKLWLNAAGVDGVV